MKNSQGFTLVELLVVIALAGILAAMAAPSIQKTANNNLQNALIQISGNLKLTRAKAMASTSAYIVTINNITISSTSPYSFNPQLTTQMVCVNGATYTASTTSSCSQPAIPASTCPATLPSPATENWSDTSEYNLNLPTSIQLSPVATFPSPSTPFSPLQICFDARGMASTSQTIYLKDTANNDNTRNIGYVQIYMGGAVQAQINGQTTAVQ